MFTGDLRTCFTFPRKIRPGNASTVNVASSPSSIRPTSDSSIEVSTCISAKFLAITKISGDCKLAATVCPTSTLRLTTTPSTGDRISVSSNDFLAKLRAPRAAFKTPSVPTKACCEIKPSFCKRTLYS